jgi:hypothetical protein
LACARLFAVVTSSACATKRSRSASSSLVPVWRW